MGKDRSSEDLRIKNMKQIRISAIVIARNEERDLPDCLDSLKWVDEVVVIENGSADKTASVARKLGAKVYSYHVPAHEKGFSSIRNFSAKKAVGTWLLYIDADERVTPELRKEIELTINPSINQLTSSPVGFAAFAIPRKNILLGREMHYGGWSPDYVLRLIRKESLKTWSGKLHEQPEIKGQVGKLENRLIHITHTSITEMVTKTNKWSEIEAKLLYDSGHPPMNIFRFFTAGFREFWYRGVRKLGFLDGTVGWIEIVYQVYSRLITYSKLWEMQLQNAKIKNQNAK